MKKFFSFFAALLFAGSMMAAEVEIAKATFDGKAGKYTEGWTTTGTGVSRNDCVIIGKDENITSPSIDLSAYKSISITFKARRYGSLSGSKATIKVTYGAAELGTIDVTSSSVGDVAGAIEYTVPEGAAASSFVFTCTNATSAGSSHGAGIGAITITGDNGAEATVANYCQTEITHAMNPAETASAVLLSVGVKGEKTIVRIDKKNAEAANLDFLQVTPNNVGSQLEEGGSEALAIEIATPTPVNDSLTLEILWSTVGFPGNWMVQNLRVAVADCEKAVVPVTPISCSDIYKAAKGDKVALADVVVTYVNGKSVYVKDESGAMLLYLPANATWKAGDKLAGVEGELDIYNGLYEIKPTADQVAAVVATAGEAPAPVELAVAPVAADVNKYVILKNVSVAAGEFKTDKASNLDLTIGDATVVLRNNFKIAQKFEAGKKYIIEATVAVYNDAVQLYFISAEEYIEPADRRINAWGLNVVADGEKYKFSYNANIDGNEANLVFYKDGVEIGDVAIAAPKKGANEATVGKDEIPQGAGLTWGVELKANPVKTFGKVYESPSAYNRLHAAVDNSPESDYFQRIYMSNNGAVGKGLFILNQDYSAVNAEVLTAGLTWGSPCRLDVDAYGKVWISDWADGDAAGVWILDPANTASVSQFFDFASKTSKGQYKNAEGVEIGEGCPAVGVFGEGKDMVVYTAGEEGGTTLKPNGLNIYKVGQEDGSVLYKWGKAPSVIADIQNNANGNNSYGATSHGVFMGQNRSAGQNNATAYAAMFYDKTGTQRWNSDVSNYPEIDGCNGGGLGVSWDEKRLGMIDASGNALIYDIAWTEDVPSLTLAGKYAVANTFAGQVDFDYAGNLLMTLGPSYAAGSMAGKLYVYGVPTDNNEIIVPAKKALKVDGTKQPTAIDNSFVPVKAEKVIRGGQVLIIRDGKAYNMMGQIVE